MLSSGWWRSITRRTAVEPTGPRRTSPAEIVGRRFSSRIGAVSRPESCGGTWNSDGSITYYTSLSTMHQVIVNDGDTRPFQGYYGPEARLMLMIARHNGWAGAQAAYDYLFPQIGVASFANGLSDLANRSGWAIAFDGEP